MNAASATWAFELGRLAETILAQLRAELGDATPRTLKFAPGPVPGPRADAATVPAAAPEIAAKHSADAAEIAAGIEDDELRRLVARAAAASLANAHREPPDDRGF